MWRWAHLLYAAEDDIVISKAKERRNDTASAQKSAYVSSHLTYLVINLFSFIFKSTAVCLLSQALTHIRWYLDGTHAPPSMPGVIKCKTMPSNTLRRYGS